MRKIKLKDEEVLFYSKKMGGTLRFFIDEDGFLWVKSQDIVVKVDTEGCFSSLNLETEAECD
jgi:hypothetical protein